MQQPEALTFSESDWVPNHPSLPVLLYRGVFDGQDSERAEMIESRFSTHQWQGLWRDGVFSYQHYHSQAHEVLAIAKGHARLLIGGSNGSILDVSGGDCLILPVGTGHMRLEATADFLVIGAYPPGQEADILTEAPSPAQKEAIAQLPLPATDPVYGANGPLLSLWR